MEKTKNKNGQYHDKLYKDTVVEIVEIAKLIDVVSGVSFLMGHLRELAFSAEYNVEIAEKVHRREEALKHTLPIILKFGIKSSEYAQIEEVMKLLDNVQRLMDISDMMNQYEVLPESSIKQGVEVKLKNVVPEDMKDFIAYHMRVVQHHILGRATLEYPSEWSAKLIKNFAPFDLIFGRVIGLRAKDMASMLNAFAVVQFERLDVRVGPYTSHEITAPWGAYDFKWGVDTFAWSIEDINEIFGEERGKGVIKFLETFSFSDVETEIPFVRYIQVQFAPIIKIFSKWYFSVDYLIGFFMPMLDYSLDAWVKKGLAKEKEVRTIAESVLIEEVSTAMVRGGYHEIFRQKQFRPKKEDDVDVPTEIDLLFMTVDGDYLAIEVKGGGLSFDMLYDLSFIGFLKERKKAFKRLKQLRNQDKVLGSKFGRRKLKEYEPSYDSTKKIGILCVSRYPFISTKSSEYNSISLGELRIFLSKGISLLEANILAEEWKNYSPEDIEIPDNLKDIVPESDFALLNDMPAAESASKFIGWAVWDCSEESFAAQRFPDMAVVLVFQKQRHAAVYAKKYKKGRTCRFLEIQEGSPVIGLCKPGGFDIYVVDNLKDGDVVGGWLLRSNRA